MGLLNKLPILGSFLYCFFVSGLNAQEEVNADLEHIYNIWALSIQESENDILVYVDENDLYFDNIPYNQDDNLKFRRGNKVFYLKYSGDETKPARCGNYIPKTVIRKSTWKKGVWNIRKEAEGVFLVLDYLIAEKGKKYDATSQLLYEIVHLEEDKMILRKLENEI